MAQCTKIKANGKQCQTYAFSDGSGMCIFHSTSSQAKEARKVNKILSKEKLIYILQKELRRVKKLKDDDLGRSGEIRRLVELISRLKGELQSPIEGENNEDPLDNILNKWEKEKKQKKEKNKGEK